MDLRHVRQGQVPKKLLPPYEQTNRYMQELSAYFSFLSREDLPNCRLVSKKWRRTQSLQANMAHAQSQAAPLDDLDELQEEDIDTELQQLLQKAAHVRSTANDEMVACLADEMGTDMDAANALWQGEFPCTRLTFSNFAMEGVRSLFSISSIATGS